VRPDDPSISGETWLLRALPYEGWYKIEEDQVRVTSVAFVDNRTGEVSCYVDSSTRRQDLSANRFPGCFMARFTAAQARECGFNVTSDPDSDFPEHSPEHIVLTFGRENVAKNAIQRAAKLLGIRCELIPPS
jgi:hypothetical protein